MIVIRNQLHSSAVFNPLSQLVSKFDELQLHSEHQNIIEFSYILYSIIQGCGTCIII
jgi:hypothetical protein